MSANGLDHSSRMHSEAESSSKIVGGLLRENATLCREIADEIRAFDPQFAVTNARGSSDHAGLYAKYLIMMKCGLAVASGAPSIASIFGKRLSLSKALGLSISQSGHSPDIVQTAAALREGGAYSLALINQSGSPLEEESSSMIPLCAGEEKSVAATKSFIASLAVISLLISEWSLDKDFRESISMLPDLLGEAWELDWSSDLSKLSDFDNLFVIGRGLCFSTASEAALKFKETCQIHAEAFSTAECMHGPAALVGPNFPVLVFAQDDETLESTIDVCQRLIDLNATVFIAGARLEGAITLPVLYAPSELQPILMIQSFYRAIANLAVSKGLNPDQPPFLQKVTKTI